MIRPTHRWWVLPFASRRAELVRCWAPCSQYPALQDRALSFILPCPAHSARVTLPLNVAHEG